MIKTGIDITPYKLTTLGGSPACGKSFIAGLLIDELLDNGKLVYYLDIDGVELPRFDYSHPNVVTFMYRDYEDVIDLYKKANMTGEEIYIVVDGMGDLYFNRYKKLPYYLKYKFFLEDIRRFENIKSLVTYNYHRNNSHKPMDAVTSSIMQVSDYNIDVEKIFNENFGAYDMYINGSYLCKLNELTTDPKIRAKKMSRERKISTLMD